MKTKIVSKLTGDGSALGLERTVLDHHLAGNTRSLQVPHDYDAVEGGTEFHPSALSKGIRQIEPWRRGGINE
ncbi:MAG TPA: hypothetical protein VG754_00610 [Verrucomicrobiae bacterium]|jgi:hypothetical protein|nr:hypothetical protein [Verrucomicrobiae bacterium]